MTTFATIYNRFLDKVTDDMYVELTPEDTLKDLNRLLIAAIPGFEFPRQNLYEYTKDVKEISEDELTDEDFIIQEIEHEPVTSITTINWTFYDDFDPTIYETAVTLENNSLTIGVNQNDTIDSEKGLVWSSSSNNNTDSYVTNNRYIKYTPTQNGTLQIMFKGSKLYVSCGTDIKCTTIDNSENQFLEGSLEVYNVMVPDVEANKTYYIWCYSEDKTETFNIHDITFVAQEYTTTEIPNTIEIDNSYFEADLNSEEINILAYLMLEGWLQRQVTSIENTRMKFSGSDFSFSSQANHLSKLSSTLEKTQTRCFHYQRLYKRRKFDDDGRYQSNWSNALGKSVFD